MDKEDFIKIFETTLICADLDVTALTLISDNIVQITFKGNGKRNVDITCDSFGAIITDVMKHVY